MDKLNILLFVFTLFFKDTLQLKGDLPFEVWNDIIIYNGQNNITFAPTPDTSGFITLSVHSPFNAIWASLLPGCPTHVSQFGFHLGLVSRQKALNTSGVLFICSFNAKPIQGAIKLSSYSPEYAVPGGCGISASDSFSASTIITHWDSQNDRLPKPIDDEPYNSSEMLNFWTSTVSFYAASDQKNGIHTCVDTLDQNSSFLDNIVYHLYYVPLVICGGTIDTFTNPTTSDVLKTLSRFSSSGDTLFRGSLVTSISGRDLQLQKDFSYTVPIVRHLATASVINIIAEYKISTPTSGESSTFVSYTPTILYMCPSTERSTSDVHNLSNQLNCSLISDAPGVTRFCVGLLMIIAIVFAVSGRFFVWIRCGISLMVTYCFLFLMFFYRYTSSRVTTTTQVVIGVLVPSLASLFSMGLFWCCCIRRSYIIADPLPPSIFKCPLGGGVSDIPSSRILTTDEMEGHAPSIGGDNKTGDQQLPVAGSSSLNLFSVASLQTDFNEVGPSSSIETVEGDVGVGTGLGARCSRKINQYRLRRLARLSAILPAVFLICSLIGNTCLDSFAFLRGKYIYLCFFIFISIGLILLLSIYKNFAFGLAVGVTGIYVALCSIALLFFPASFLPYVLIDQFLLLTWPERRLPVRRILAYGSNDVIFLVLWLAGSLLVGLFTLCLLRLNDAQDHASNMTRFSMGPLRRSLPSLVPRFPRFRSIRRRAPNLPPPVEEASFEHQQQREQPEEQTSILTSLSVVWPPQPFSDRTYLGFSPDPRLSRQRPLHCYGSMVENSTPQLVPLSRVQIAAAETGNYNRLLSDSVTRNDGGDDGRNPFGLSPPTYSDVLSSGRR